MPHMNLTCSHMCEVAIIIAQSTLGDFLCIKTIHPNWGELLTNDRVELILGNGLVITSVVSCAPQLISCAM